MRERWFLADGDERRGPFALQELIDALRRQPDPFSQLVWRKGFAQWTPARALPELAHRLVLVPARSAGDTAAASVPSPPKRVTHWLRRSLPVAAATLLIALAVVAVLPRLRRSPEPQPSPAPPERGSPTPPVVTTTTPPAVATTVPTLPASPPPVAAPTRPADPLPPADGLADDEAAMPSHELRSLRGVAAWAGESLQLTVYNGTAWRVTELHVRIGRFTGEEFVEDARSLTLVRREERVNAGVADLLDRVVPDRKRPGLNPLDTGVFEATAGPRPEGFRWEIEGARGYPPRP